MPLFLYQCLFSSKPLPVFSHVWVSGPPPQSRFPHKGPCGPCRGSSFFPFLILPNPHLTSTHLFSISVILSFQQRYINGIIQYAWFGFWDWLFTLRIIPFGSIQVVCINRSFFHCQVHSIPQYCYACHSLFNQSPGKEYMGSFQLGLLWMKLLWTVVYIFLCDLSFYVSERSA